MSIQFKSITELNELIDKKAISVSELTQESIQLAKAVEWALNTFQMKNIRKKSAQTTFLWANEVKGKPGKHHRKPFEKS